MAKLETVRFILVMVVISVLTFVLRYLLETLDEDILLSYWMFLRITYRRILRSTRFLLLLMPLMIKVSFLMISWLILDCLCFLLSLLTLNIARAEAGVG